VATTGTLNAVELVGTKGWVVGDRGKVFHLLVSSH
jgi:hypothetical protein